MALLLVALALPTTLFAQSTANPRLADSSVASVSQTESATPLPSAATSVALPGPRVAPAALVAVTRTTPFANAPTPPSAGGDVGPNLALIGVGAAAVVVGYLCRSCTKVGRLSLPPAPPPPILRACLHAGA